MAVFTFTLNSFQILETRSFHKDTDYVSFSLVVNPADGQGSPQILKKSMGDLNNGSFPLNMSFANVVVNPTDTVVLNYLIMNSGFKAPGDVEKAMEAAGRKLLMEGADEVAMWLDGVGIPDTKAVLEAVAKFVSDIFTNILNADCDGWVAGGQYNLPYDKLIANTAVGTYRQNTTFNGTDSPAGCGKNSVYVVDSQMVEIGNPVNRTVPDLFESTVPIALKTLEAAGLVAKFLGPNGSQSWVLSQSPIAGTIVGAGSTVTMNLQTGPQP